MSKIRVCFFVMIFVCLFTHVYSTNVLRVSYKTFLKKFDKIELPYHTRSIEQAKELKSGVNGLSFWGKQLAPQDSIYYTPPPEFEKGYWTIDAMAAGRYKYGDIDVLLFFLTGDCENGASLRPMLELCTYKNKKIVSRIIVEGGQYEEYGYYKFYESIIDNGTVRVIEEVGEQGVSTRQEKLYQIDISGRLITKSL